MRRLFVIIILLFALQAAEPLQAQCSVCTRTAQQMGERPAKALNGGILYLATMPLLIFSYIGYRWWKHNR
ncbi:MAG: hypothetical protein JST39_14695 [Bacteroidetes bacterium]|nr:hypothetical protein [Bacteroidota bacterium]